jgi:hypothetical protein
MLGLHAPPLFVLHCEVTYSSSRCSFFNKVLPVQGGFDPSEISGVGTKFWLLVHVLRDRIRDTRQIKYDFELS